MIPATHPCQAVFENGTKTNARGAQVPTYTSLPVIAWDADGDALVMGERELELARRRPGFVRLASVRHPIAAILPSRGEVAIFKDENGEEYVEPIHHWIVRTDGESTAVIVDGDTIDHDAVDLDGFVEIRFPLPS